jgi:hypothetical protein
LVLLHAYFLTRLGHEVANGRSDKTSADERFDEAGAVRQNSLVADNARVFAT